MKIDLICVGRIKEAFYTDAVKEYSKRLSRYCSLSITEVKDEKTPEDISAAERERILKTEGERILGRIRDGSCLVVLDIGGKRFTSEGLAGYISALANSSVSHITFVIGGSLGLWEELKARAALRLSFSDFTFPHQLMRVILLEQIYRCFRIIHNEPYHK